MLIRRLSLDLTGLPPTREAVEAFVADTSAQAYEKVVDRLLDSPHYGERMALIWLDAARYADSGGYQNDIKRSQWPWRDWVIKAYNDNLPFSQFTIEQLAGDLLPNPSEGQRLATAFNRNHRINNEGGIIPAEFLNEYAALWPRLCGIRGFFCPMFRAWCHRQARSGLPPPRRASANPTTAASSAPRSSGW